MMLGLLDGTGDVFLPSLLSLFVPPLLSICILEYLPVVSDWVSSLVCFVRRLLTSRFIDDNLLQPGLF